MTALLYSVGKNQDYTRAFLLIPRESLIKGGKAAAASGLCARNNMKLRKPIIATNIATGEQRWYLSACHAAADKLGSRSAISGVVNNPDKYKSNNGWAFRFVNKQSSTICSVPQSK